MKRDICGIKELINENLNIISDETPPDNYENNTPYQHTFMEDEYLTTEEAAAFLKVTSRTIYNYRKEKKLPVHYLNNKKPRYRRSDLEGLLEKKEAKK